MRGILNGKKFPLQIYGRLFGRYINKLLSLHLRQRDRYFSEERKYQIKNKSIGKKELNPYF
jgi:hypothetical protein